MSRRAVHCRLWACLGPREEAERLADHLARGLVLPRRDPPCDEAAEFGGKRHVEAGAMDCHQRTLGVDGGCHNATSERWGERNLAHSGPQRLPRDVSKTTGDRHRHKIHPNQADDELPSPEAPLER